MSRACQQKIIHKPPSLTVYYLDRSGSQTIYIAYVHASGNSQTRAVRPMTALKLALAVALPCALPVVPALLSNGQLNQLYPVYLCSAHHPAGAL